MSLDTVLPQLLAGQSIDLTMQDQMWQRKPDGDDVVTLTVPARLKRVGREMRMLVENSDDQTAADPSLLRIIARAHDIQARLIQNTKLTVHDHRSRGASDGGLHLYPPASSLAGARHHHGHYQWSATAATQCQEVDAADIAAAGRLG